MEKEHPAQKKNQDNIELLTYGEHLEVLRQIIFRIIIVVGLLSIAIFCLKDFIWGLLLAPSEWDFCTYVFLERVMQKFGIDFHFNEFFVEMIATDLSSQFMAHITTSVSLGLLCASPYILFELFRFISPALYENEKKHSVQVAAMIYILFMLGVLMNYFVLFPISFRFLGTYSVAERVHSTITLDSYVGTFTSLTLMMGIVFQLPIIAFVLAKMEIISSEVLSYYRKHAFLLIMLVAAVITPPDIMTLIIVTIPLYLLFEISIKVVSFVENKQPRCQ